MSQQLPLHTARLTLRRLQLADAAFILDLVNEPGWLRFIGDKGVRTLADAERYLLDGPLAMYERHGFGLYLVTRTRDCAPIGMCGLIKRDTLDAPDIGFAFLASVHSNGFAYEAAHATREHARALGLTRLLAIVTADNRPSRKLLEKLDLRLEREIHMPGSPDPLCLYAADLRPADLR